MAEGKWTTEHEPTQAPPEQPATADQPESDGAPVMAKSSKKKKSPVKTFFKILMWLIVILALVGAVGYFLASSGRVSYLHLSNLGAADISIVNIADSNVDVRVVGLVLDEGGPSTVGSEDIDPLGITGFGGLVPGPYRVEFGIAGEAPADSDCTLTVEKRDSYQFVLVPEGIIVTREGFETDNPDDLLVERSPLCFVGT